MQFGNAGLNELLTAPATPTIGFIGLSGGPSMMSGFALDVWLVSDREQSRAIQQLVRDFG